MKHAGKVFTVLIILCVVCLAMMYRAATAHALGMCGSRADFVKALSDKYQETGKAFGIAGQVNLVEVFVSKTGTWSILVTTPQGKSCMIAAGKSWEDLPSVTVKQKSEGDPT